VADKRVNRNLHVVNTAERFWLWRRAANLTQAQAAKKYGMDERRYWAIEDGRLDASPVPPLPRLTHSDRCALARRRHGLTLRATAKLLGTSHVTLLAWESTADKRLVAAWNRMGYKL